MHIKTTKLTTFDGLELKEAVFQKHTFPEHYHDAYSIGIIENGIERLSFDNKQVLAHANTVIVINPYDIHANSFFDNDSWRYRTMYISEDVMMYVQRVTGLLVNKPAWFPKALIDDNYLYRLILKLHSHSSVTFDVQLRNVLAYLIRHYASIRPEIYSHKNSNTIHDAASFIQANFTGKMALDSLAARYNMDKYKFIRAFRQHTGLTPNSYLLLHRINHSKKLIARDMPIVEVALESGFYDQSHFTHYFKKYIGIAPLNYKKGLVLQP